MLILVELVALNRHPGIRFLLPVQGLLLVCAMFVMYWTITFSLFENDVTLFPAFYAALAWVAVAAIFSFLLVSKKMQHSVRRVIDIHA